MAQHLQYHNPVMLFQSIEGLNIKPDGVYVDVTFGSGGHSRAILEQLNEKGKLFAFDQDPDSKANAIEDSRFVFIHHNFKHIKNHLKFYGIEKIDGILGDLGVSSHQFDCEERGFSTRFDGCLDMRMDTRKPFKASDILNSYKEDELKRIFYQYGELFNSGKLANLIVKERAITPFTASQDFIERIKPCIPLHKEYKYLAQVYQSLRIAVNDEMDALQLLLEQSVSLLNKGGRLVIISYHSLEDRMVKVFMRSGNFQDRIEKDFYGNVLSPFVLISRKALTPSKEELESNNRSRSAKLRIAEKK
ncbi:MAG: 16S rRNA (cytosine(1402)-N(4))-methyltransferase RsmH [Bacteroidales bacterium]|jgi:16S rRNA (cytosine1402-N4)-methyltransferase|nr:16S rRNA (cytosine(1402)-N(4))-methyltransferase RsmH [Bacteroidales bacterium]